MVVGVIHYDAQNGCRIYGIAAVWYNGAHGGNVDARRVEPGDGFAAAKTLRKKGQRI